MKTCVIIPNRGYAFCRAKKCRQGHGRQNRVAGHVPPVPRDQAHRDEHLHQLQEGDGNVQLKKRLRAIFLPRLRAIHYRWSKYKFGPDALNVGSFYHIKDRPYIVTKKEKGSPPSGYASRQASSLQNPRPCPFT